VPPMDHFQDLRSEMILVMENLGIEIEVQHHEVASGGQAEIDMRYDTLLRMADKLMPLQVVVKNVARNAGTRPHSCPSPCSRTTGRGCTAPVAVDRRRAAVLRRNRLRRPVRHGAVVYSRVAQARGGGACLRLPRRRTPTSAWYRATKRR